MTTTTQERDDERAARAALAVFHTPESLAAQLAAHGPVAVWQRLAAADPTGRLTAYRPGPELSAAQLTARFVIPGDPEWPAALDALGDARPLGLWVRGPGDLAAMSARAVTVTGRRAASDQGKRTAARLAGELALAGRTVAASLSYGIDAAAHTGAHLVDAPTLAVLPCGPDACHPFQHSDLLRAVLDGGGLAVSAYRPGVPASRLTLNTTARLVAALSSAVVLVEPAADRTVPMEAAETAQRLDRPVFALPPAEAATPHSDAAAHLLSTGQAAPVRSAADVLAALT